MSIKSRTNSILHALDKYIDFISTMSDQEFQLTPQDRVWSFSEVYSHILHANTGSLIAVERCVHGNKSERGPLSFPAWLVLLFGRIPSGRKAPANIASLTEKMTTEDARNALLKFRQRLLDQVSPIARAPADQKIRHPRLGLLNAKQWLRFIEIHTLHHLRQLDRIASMHAHNPSKA